MQQMNTGQKSVNTVHTTGFQKGCIFKKSIFLEHESAVSCEKND